MVPIFKDWIQFMLGLDTSSGSTGLALMVVVCILSREAYSAGIATVAGILGWVLFWKSSSPNIN